MNYLVRLKPLEPYAFGTDNGFRIQGIQNPSKETYFIRSKEEPEQTTLLGMLRHTILENEGLLRSDFRYEFEEQKKISDCIGSESYSFSAGQKQKFGFIHGISPIFLMDNHNHYLIKNPFHNKSKISYNPIKLSEDTIETSAGLLRMPGKEEYKAKQGYASGYFDLDKGEVVSDRIFESITISGNRKNGKTGTDADCYFKRELKILNSDYTFAVFVNAVRLPGQAICHMGQKRSAFLFTAEENKENDLEKRIHKAFSMTGERWFYALSDLVLREPVCYEDFCIVEEKQIRNLETVHQEHTQIRKLRKSEKQYNLIQKGSVFFNKCPICLDDENGKQIGYNHVVRLGGK